MVSNGGCEEISVAAEDDKEAEFFRRLAIGPRAGGPDIDLA